MEFASTLIIDVKFQNCEKIKCLLFQVLSLWYFVTEGLAETYNIWQYHYVILNKSLISFETHVKERIELKYLASWFNFHDLVFLSVPFAFSSSGLFRESWTSNSNIQSYLES